MIQLMGKDINAILVAQTILIETYAERISTVFGPVDKILVLNIHAFS